MRNIDQTLYVAICQNHSVSYAPERNLDELVNREQIVNDIMSGHIDDPRRVFAFNPFEGWSNDISEDIAIEVAKRVRNMLALGGGEIPDGIRRFVEDVCGIGTEFEAAA